LDLLSDRGATFRLDKPRDLYLSSFKCLSRFLVGQVLQYRGPYPYLDGLALRCTRNIGTIEVRHAPRLEGRSNYTARRLVGLWLNVFVNFSVMPLRVSTVVGLARSVLGLTLGVEVLAERLLRPACPLDGPRCWFPSRCSRAFSWSCSACSANTSGASS